MNILNPISKLQELMVTAKKGFPVYTYQCTGSQPEMKFICTVKVSELQAVGEGRSKKIAKAIAAENALLQLGLNENPTDIKNVVKPDTPKIILNDFSENSNYTGELHQLASIQGIGYPIYEMPIFCINGHFKIICKFQGLESEGYAENKKKAKQIASYKMLENLNNNPLALEKKEAPSVKQIPVENKLQSPVKDQISINLQISDNGLGSPKLVKTAACNLESNPEPEIEA
ncbi:hypothetical protein WA026_002452 [Henosepilachna vigintioctopunctata]|uniref:DRBM domain-containing protein n=1 Tax=Henosepilachna vigintioctopunctata TaxID=420089 RepID=A0AAW1U087_9CUCU